MVKPAAADAASCENIRIYDLPASPVHLVKVPEKNIGLIVPVTAVNANAFLLLTDFLDP